MLVSMKNEHKSKIYFDQLKSQSPQTGHVGFYTIQNVITISLRLIMSQSPQTGHVGFYIN